MVGRRGRSAWRTGTDSKLSTMIACAASKGVIDVIGFLAPFSIDDEQFKVLDRSVAVLLLIKLR